MRVFKCRCNWTWIIGKKRVYGPIFEDNDAGCARLRAVEDWREEYADCAAHLDRQHRG